MDNENWTDNLEEAISRQTMKETGEYDDPGFSGNPVTVDQSSGEEHVGIPEEDSSAAQQQSVEAGMPEIPDQHEDNGSSGQVYHHSRNFVDVGDFGNADHVGYETYETGQQEEQARRPEQNRQSAAMTAGEREEEDLRIHREAACRQEEDQRAQEEEARRKKKEEELRARDTEKRRREQKKAAAQQVDRSRRKEEKRRSEEVRRSRSRLREEQKSDVSSDEERIRSGKMDSRLREQQEADEAVQDADAVLFDEVVDDSGMTTRERRKSEKQRVKDAGRNRYDNDDPDYYYERDDSRSGRRARRREQQEYEDFLEYKAEKERYGRKKKKHRFLKFLIWVAVILLVLYCLGTIGLRMLGIRQSSLNISDVRNMISEQVKESTKSGAMAHYRNIALFGVDSIDQSLDAGNNRTDVMIIASINELTGDIKLVSLYRDTYLDIGNGDYQKANAAYAYGGPDQAVGMINRNLDLNVEDYVTVGFGGVADMIDSVGGVEIDVQDDEIQHLNNYQSTMAAELGREYIPVEQAGTQTLNGLQATAYCRIRYTDGGDFKRTERQKEVLTKTFAKLKASGPATMIRAAASISSEMRTSLTTAEIAALAVQAFRYNITDTNGFPQEDHRTVGYIGDQSCVIPIHLTDNVVWLHQYLFSDTSYTVSATVQEISDTISAKSGY